jgi:hypothetical protein
VDSTPPQPPRLRPRTPAAPPPPPPADETPVAAASTPEPEPRKIRAGMSAWARRWLKFGGQGLMVSLLIHGGLLFLATAWVVSVAVIQKKEPNSFATGAGGGRGGERAVAAKAKQKPNAPKSLTKSASKITSKSASAEIALPEMPDLNRSMLGALSASSKGFGGGAGGGIGGGVGLGKGGKNFTGRAVMGMKISGAHIAVYFDSSPSMNPYFAAVEKQIKEQFPSADVYRYFGVFNLIQDGEVLGSRPNQKLVVPTVDQIYMDRRGGRRDSPATDQAKLSPAGRNMFGSKDAQFRIGGVGAWIDIMLNQKQYDAIVIFSDFEDGILQWRTIGEIKPTLVFDADLRPPTDLRTEEEKAWEARWIRTFATAQDRKAPRLYLYSTSREPQEIYRRCVSASGGDFKIVTMARGGIFGAPAKK